jgi:PST family polysaccharide transporter
MAPTSRPWGNVAFRLGAEGSARVLNFLLAIMGARCLGVEGWGLYWSAFSFAQVLSLFTDLGGHLTLSRSVTQAPSRARAVMGASLALKLLLSAVGVAVWALAGGFPGIPFTLQAVLVGSTLLISFIEWLGFHLRGFGLVPAESLLLAIDCLIAFILGGTALYRGASPLSFALSQVIAHTVVLAGSAWVLARNRNFRPIFPRPGVIAGFFLDSLPTGIAQAASLGSWRLGIMYLAVVPGDGPVSAGLFAAAHRVLEAARFFPAAAAAALFPSFSLKNPAERPFRAVLFLLPVAILTALMMNHPYVSGTLAQALFGAGYGPVSGLLAVIWWAFPFMTVNWVMSHWLVARRRVKTNALLSVAQLAVHVVALVLLVPLYGLSGAGWALVISEGFYSAASLSVLWGRK